MRHQRRSRIFNRPKEGRAALLRHLSASLIRHGRIETTVAKAKETRCLTDRLIQFGLRGDLTSYRKALRVLGSSELTAILFKDIAPLFKNRQGGYTRLLRSRIRPGDGVELAILELVEKRIELPKKKHPPSPPHATEGPPSEKERKKEEKKKKGGFFANLRKFMSPKDRT